MVDHTNADAADPQDVTHAQIGQVAERTSLSIRTIRHYDEVGLIVPSDRSAGGFRLYTEQDVQRLLLVRKMKPLGFSLEEMRTLLDAVEALADTSTHAEARAAAKAIVLVYHQQAEQRCGRLRSELVAAEEFAARLAAQAST